MMNGASAGYRAGEVGEDLPAEDEAEDDDPLRRAALPAHPEEEARASRR